MKKEKEASDAGISSDIKLRLNRLEKKAQQQKIIACKILQGLDKHISSSKKKE